MSVGSASANLFSQIRAAIKDPERVFLEEPDGRALAYGEMVAMAGRVANALIALGVKVGDRVAMQAEKSPQALLTYLGCLRAGAVFLPLNAGYTLAEVEYFLTDAEPALVLCRPADLEAMRALSERLGGARVESLGARGEGTFWPMVEAQSPEFADAVRQPDDLAAILYTSGTTGRSKGAMLSHVNLASNALTLKDYWRFSAQDVLIHALPIFHTHGLFVATNICLLAGASMLFLPKFDADRIIALMGRATSLMGVPTFYARLLEHPGLTADAAKGMRLFISGSAPLLAETHREFLARTGHAILERYGMTETNMNTSNPYEGERIAGTVGFALPGVSIRIADAETGEILPQGEIGVLEVKGPNVFQGYWRMPEKTAAEFRPDGYFISGDVAFIDARGYARIVGRAKDLVISGGFNVYPKEIETEIDAMDGVAESAVIGLAHRDFGEAVTAVVVPAKGAALEEAAILAALETRLAKFKRPKRVVFVKDLPRNAMGKVQKNVLRETYRDLYEPAP